MRLLLAAFSGVRVHNQRLLQVGLTLPGFVERSRVISSLPSPGLLTLAAHTPDEWHIDYLEISDPVEESGSPSATCRWPMMTTCWRRWRRAIALSC